jgi:hypothetical protein
MCQPRILVCKLPLLVGAMIAVGFEWVLKGKPTAAGTFAARGNLGDE